MRICELHLVNTQELPDKTAAPVDKHGVYVSQTYPQAKSIYSCPRVSLGVKNTTGLEKYHLLMAHYRFLTELREIKTGKPNMVLGLSSLLGWTADAIVTATGCKLATVEKYLDLLAKPAERSLVWTCLHTKFSNSRTNFHHAEVCFSRITVQFTSWCMAGDHVTKNDIKIPIQVLASQISLISL